MGEPGEGDIIISDVSVSRREDRTDKIRSFQI